MRSWPFYKYQATGNDFVCVNFMDGPLFDLEDQEFIAKLCHRKLGIGADGLLVLHPHDSCDFEMKYFNADGRLSSMCGNGGRTIVHFAKEMSVIDGDYTQFMAYDGIHEAAILASNRVKLSMMDVTNIEKGRGYYVLDTGSPHYVTMVEDISDLDIVQSGRAIRYSSPFKENGINVNFVETKADGIIVATYERGVEDETLSCGTGVTASALSYFIAHKTSFDTPDKYQEIAVETKGGHLAVSFQYEPSKGFTHIFLEGEVTKVFEGAIIDNNSLNHVVS